MRLKEQLDDTTRQVIIAVLSSKGGEMRSTASELGISLATLYRRCSKLNINCARIRSLCRRRLLKVGDAQVLVTIAPFPKVAPITREQLELGMYHSMTKRKIVRVTHIDFVREIVLFRHKCRVYRCHIREFIANFGKVVNESIAEEALRAIKGVDL
jgi:hypothetical protein